MAAPAWMLGTNILSNLIRYPRRVLALRRSSSAGNTLLRQAYFAKI